MAKVTSKRIGRKTRKRKIKEVLRKIIAIGDLHGDYYKMVRHLIENNLVNPDDLKWKKTSSNIDLVLIGDYVDWRGEVLEGNSREWINGSQKILVLLKNISEQLEIFRREDISFKSYLHLILGNHDDMMLSSLKIFDILKTDELGFLYSDFFSFGDLSGFFREKGLDKNGIEQLLSFTNWFYQGGRETIASFGTLQDWKREMDGSLGDFLRKNLKLAVKIDGVFFSHSISDNRNFWKPADVLNKEILELSPKEAVELKKEYVWGRKLWGYNYRTGFYTNPFTQEEIEELVKILGVEKIVVGHTPLSAKEIVEYFNGRIINLDFHGMSGSLAFVKEYERNN